jgi:hypothetical protein
MEGAVMNFVIREIGSLVLSLALGGAPVAVLIVLIAFLNRRDRRQACADQLEPARASADRGLKLIRERGERGYEAWALRLLGEVASHPDRPDVAAAGAHYGAALSLASELGMRPLVAHCHLGLGRLYGRNDAPKAAEHLTTAATMYREMEMRFWLGRAEVARRPSHRNSP